MDDNMCEQVINFMGPIIIGIALFLIIPIIIGLATIGAFAMAYEIKESWERLKRQWK